METGTVIHATLRPEDLIPAFMEELERRSIRAASRITSEYAADGWPYSMSGLHYGDPFTKKQSELAPHLLEDLFDALNEVAPEGHYFGAHMGDGSDFGFWQGEAVDSDGICQFCGREYDDLADCACPSDDCPSKGGRDEPDEYWEDLHAGELS